MVRAYTNLGWQLADKISHAMRCNSETPKHGQFEEPKICRTLSVSTTMDPVKPQSPCRGLALVVLVIIKSREDVLNEEMMSSY